MHTRFILPTAEFLMRSIQAKQKKRRIIPGFSLTMGTTVVMMSIFVLIPLVSILGYGVKLDPGTFASVITSKNVLSAFATSIGCAFVAALLNAVFGLILAWVLVRYDFPGKRILDGMIELPFALPTAVAGITLSKMYSNTGEIGGLLAHLGIKISYTHAGIVVALVFIGIPFVVRSVTPVLEKLSPAYEQAAMVMGASGGKTFFRIILPELMPALLSGFALAFARGIGEYGSVIYISGNSAKDGTQVLSYVIMQKLNYVDYEGACAIAIVMLVIAFLMLLLINGIAVYQSRHTAGDEVAASGTVTPKRKGFSGRERLLIIIAILFEVLMLLMPLISVIRNAFSKGFGFYLSSITTNYVKSALGVTILATVIALVVSTLFGLLASWLLTRYRFKGRQVLGALIDIPFSISPVIAGLAFIMIFGRMGWAYPIIESINTALGTDIQIVFALPGVFLATIFVTFPFVSRELIPVLNSVGNDEEEAAAMMGGSGFKIWRKITFPHIKWPLIYGMILCMARAMGEFGAVNALSKTRGETFTLPLEIDALYLSGSADSIVSAFAVSSILVFIAIAVLILRSVFEEKEKKNVS